MKYKDGVYVEVVIIRQGNKYRLKPSPEITHAMKVADNLSLSVCGKEITITAILDGTHKKGSKHYEAHAFDIRTTHKRYYTTEQITDLSDLLKIALDNNYDIVIHNTHIHIEFDPKWKKQ